MSRMESIFYRLTGVAGRHNRSLVEVRDWLATLEKFLRTYGLWGEDADLQGLLKSSGDAKFDLTGIAYKGRGMVARAREIMDGGVVEQVSGMLKNVEKIRRYLMNPALQAVNLLESFTALREYYQTLHEALENIEYL